MRYLTIQEIIETNRTVILRTGGFTEGAGRLSNPNSLKYLVEIVQEKADGCSIYSSVSSKAAAYAFNIITRHIFLDGNKRTGIACAFMFLRLNGLQLAEFITDDEIVELTLKIAKGTVTIDELADWVQARIV